MTRIFRRIFIMEVGRAANKWTFGGIAVLLTLTVTSVFIGAGRYKQSVARQNGFKSAEDLKADRCDNYLDYGRMGHKIQFQTPPISVLFYETGIVGNMVGRVTIDRSYEVHVPVTGSNIHDGELLMRTDFAGCVLLLGTLIALFYGYHAYRYKDFLMVLCSFGRTASIYFSTAFSRLLLMAVTFSALLAVALATSWAAGVPVPVNQYVLIFWGLCLLLLTVSFASGAALSRLNVKYSGALIIAACWFALVNVAPAVLVAYAKKGAEELAADYRRDVRIMSAYSSFLKEITHLENQRKPEKTRAEERKALIDTFIAEDLHDIKMEELKRLFTLKDHAAHHHRLLSLLPTAFFTSACSEVGANGHRNGYKFRRDLIDRQEAFSEKVIRNAFSSKKEKASKPCCDSDNIHVSESLLPGNFREGLAATCFYIVVLFGVGYLRFSRMLYQPHVLKKKDEKEKSLRFDIGKCYSFRARTNKLVSMLYNYFSGRFHPVKAERKNETDTEPITVSLNGASPIDGKSAQNFFYLANPWKFPDNVKLKDFLHLIAALGGIQSLDLYAAIKTFRLEPSNQRMKALKDDWSANLTKALLCIVKRDIFLLDGIMEYMEIETVMELKDTLQDLAAKNKAVILVSSQEAFDALYNKEPDFFYNNSHWMEAVNHIV